MVDVSREGGCIRISYDVENTEILVLRDVLGKSYQVEACWCEYEIATDQRLVGFKVRGNSDDWARNVMSQVQRESVR
jgi:hypothetical protein